MKKILLATSALVASTGFAAAEVAISGSANMGFEYAENTTGADETTPFSEVFVTFDMSGETDGGLSFGATTVYTVNNNGNPANDDTWVWISGAWGKLSMGAVAEADQVAGLSDLGLDGIGTDNVAEVLSGDDTTGLAHDVNYTYSGGALTLGLSANFGDGTAVLDNQSAAIGAKYNFGDFYLGLGYADHSGLAALPDHTVTSVFAGGNVANLKVAAMYSMADTNGVAVDGTVDPEAYGVTVAYSMGATTLTAAYSDNDLGSNTDASYGVGVAYDLGGGASLKGAVGSINDQNRADFGIAMSF